MLPGVWAITVVVSREKSSAGRSTNAGYRERWARSNGVSTSCVAGVTFSTLRSVGHPAATELEASFRKGCFFYAGTAILFQRANDAGQELRLIGV
jgi:hypothetical protein